MISLHRNKWVYILLLFLKPSFIITTNEKVEHHKNKFEKHIIWNRTKHKIKCHRNHRKWKSFGDT